ncbi:MAG: hypothetical protein R3F62_14430 [Planctomycetota bacterium]
MSLSHPKVLATLRRHFVCGWTDISGAVDYAGTSNTHGVDFPAAQTTNCAGHHNVQLFVLTPDARVLHVLPGFWAPEPLLEELALARTLGRIWADPRRSVVEKNQAFLDLQLEHALAHSAETRARSALQGFDRWEAVREEGSDFRRDPGFLGDDVGLLVKSADQVVHERVAALPFMPFGELDVAALVDMGKKAFDAHTDGCHGDHVGSCSAELAVLAGKAPAPATSAPLQRGGALPLGSGAPLPLTSPPVVFPAR